MLRLVMQVVVSRGISALVLYLPNHVGYESCICWHVWKLYINYNVYMYRFAHNLSNEMELSCYSVALADAIKIHSS
jgi:hypothetical protein